MVLVPDAGRTFWVLWIAFVALILAMTLLQMRVAVVLDADGLRWRRWVRWRHLPWPEVQAVWTTGSRNPFSVRSLLVSDERRKARTLPLAYDWWGGHRLQAEHLALVGDAWLAHRGSDWRPVSPPWDHSPFAVPPEFH
ncbi:hypothetical protein GCM10025868_30030 [Angustibacter aerolatus]|uniref:Low molecular weight protein antigen 6 PH domain-containing protein n=1 Tax=Angustibacter aerolatus TaxID=1162965 RepID=A0ABQ6JK22_9ACTN|nr:PH domain-containing protein [Angustibacter aerolatus]GMA87753.1 hypothetical protein GCM10025868_30030 [Angustibacter aerolatus]